MAWILTKNKTNGSGESQIDTIKVNDVILIPDSDKAVNIEVPTNTNDLVNNSGFITNTVDNLLNYYLKTETYSKNEVNSLIDAVSSVTFEVVQVLPSQDISVSTIYLVPKQDAETNDIYDEYIYVNDVWEKIGSTEMDLTNYVTTSDLNNALTAYTTSQNLNNLLNAKQDVLTPGNNIDITNGVISATDTTYTSKSAVSGGTDVSLVTTGEKYNWNSKVDSSNLADVALSGDYNDLTNKPSLSNKQDKTDNGIKTIAKTVVGAINELLNKFTNYYTKTEVNEKVDPIKAHTRTNLLNPTARTQTKNGVTLTNNGDGTYTVDGTASGNAIFTLVNFNDYSILENTKLVGSPVGGGTNTTYSMYITCYNGSAWLKDYVDHGDGVLVSNIPSEANSIRLLIIIRDGYTANNLLFKPMLTTDLNATYDDYVPYTGDSGRLNEDVAQLNSDLNDKITNNTCTNLLNPTAQTQTVDGVTFTNNGDGTYTVNGTASAQAYILATSSPVDLIPFRNKDIRIAGCPTGGGANAYQFNINISDASNGDIARVIDYGGGSTYHVPSNAHHAYIVLVVQNGYTANNLLFKPMLTTDLNATYNDFVQYSGDGELNKNVAEIYKVSDRVSDETYTNLINPNAQTQTKNGITFTNNGDGTYTINGTATAWTFLNINYIDSSTLSVPVGTYKLTGTPPSNNKGIRTQVVSSEVTFGTDEVGDGSIFTIPQSATTSWVRIVVDGGVVCNNFIFKPMITTKLDATYDDFIRYTGDSGRLNEDVAEMKSDLSAFVITRNLTAPNVNLSAGGSSISTISVEQIDGYFPIALSKFGSGSAQVTFAGIDLTTTNVVATLVNADKSNSRTATPIYRIVYAKNL